MLRGGVVQAVARFKTDPGYTSQVIAKYSQIDDPGDFAERSKVYLPLFTVDPYPDRDAIQAVLDVEENRRRAPLGPTRSRTIVPPTRFARAASWTVCPGTDQPFHNSGRRSLRQRVNGR